jgi:uncharacterized protein
MYEQRRETTPSRHPERASFDEALIDAVLDEALVGHLAFVADNLPQVLPLLFVRLGRTLFVHGSTGAHFARMAARQKSLLVSFEVTLVDGLVLARSAFNHSANYRCVIAHGTARLVTDAERKAAVLDALLDKLVPGRRAEVRAPTADELRKTAVLELDLDEVGAKVRTGGPLDAEADLSLPVWAGVWPIERAFGSAQRSPDLAESIPEPAYLAR